MAEELSVVVCTHNPRREYLTRALEHLRRQSLPPGQWELLVVDNRSEPAVAEWCDLSWHPKARIVREESLGLTNAVRHLERMRAESAADRGGAAT